MSDFHRGGTGTNSSDFRLNRTEKYLTNAAKHRAKRRGIEFSISHRDIEIPQYCPLLGIPIIINIGEGHTINSPSIDRIDNTVGYTKDNVWVISSLANTMKNAATLPELVAFAKNVLQYFG